MGERPSDRVLAQQMDLGLAPMGAFAETGQLAPASIQAGQARRFVRAEAISSGHF
ncbi:MAG: hypothetical protein U0894_04155 [Pirellulales bacterium]